VAEPLRVRPEGPIRRQRPAAAPAGLGHGRLVHTGARTPSRRQCCEKVDPPDAWERERDRRISALQGRGNGDVEDYRRQ